MLAVCRSEIVRTGLRPRAAAGRLLTNGAKPPDRPEERERTQGDAHGAPQGRARQEPAHARRPGDLARRRVPKVTQVLLAKWMCRAQRLAGFEVTGGIHILRHTFCSRLAMAGASTKAIQEFAGHEQMSTTQRSCTSRRPRSRRRSRSSTGARTSRQRARTLTLRPAVEQTWSRRDPREGPKRRNPVVP